MMINKHKKIKELLKTIENLKKSCTNANFTKQELEDLDGILSDYLYYLENEEDDKK